jgi:hypothetical protein
MQRDECAADDSRRRVPTPSLHGHLLRDPLELRPLPLSGIPGWHAGNDSEAFHLTTECYQPLRQGRHYPAPLSLC